MASVAAIRTHLTHLADTSVFARLRLPPVAEAVATLARSARLARPAITDLELGFSAHNGADHDATVAALAAYPVLEIGPAEFRRARQVQRLLADAGLKGRKVPDLLIAAAAEGAGLVVLHYDADFDRIASVSGQPAEWVVARGSID